MPLTINPPLCNSANPWATGLNDLRNLYNCPHTGAVTTRTAQLGGFEHDDSVHQYTFFNPHNHQQSADIEQPAVEESGSLNTLGYSPVPLKEYLEYIRTISGELDTSTHDGVPDLSTDGGACDRLPMPSKRKPFIISVTGDTTDIVECYRLICAHTENVLIPLAMEINLSCPNIPDKPPPAYSGERLVELLTALREGVQHEASSRRVDVPIGIKTPPYTYAGQFKTLIGALLNVSSENQPCPIAFITTMNTLGSSLLLSSKLYPSLNSANESGIGGMAGSALHPLALGNVKTISTLLKEHEELRSVQVIGVGGVSDADGYKRMRSVGACAVEVGTALGARGVQVFQEIADGLGGDW